MLCGKRKNLLDWYHRRVLNALENCRTSALGGHVEQCDACGEMRISYNSCRNRHCPKCQGGERDRRIASSQEDVLDCKYFHNVFTLPECLNPYCLKYPKVLYDILFKSSKETLERFGSDAKYRHLQPSHTKHGQRRSRVQLQGLCRWR